MTPAFVVMGAEIPKPKRQNPKKHQRSNSAYSLEIFWCLALWRLGFARVTRA
jgi:hypothetical protein